MRKIGGEIRIHQKREPAHGAVPLLKLLLSGSIVFRFGLDAFVFIELKRQGDCAVKTVCIAVFAHGEVVKGDFSLKSRNICGIEKIMSFHYRTKLIHYLCSKFNLMIAMEDINRLKLVLVEKKKTGKWLAEQLKKDPSTVSKWCTNVSQPDLVTLSRIAELLNIDRKELINKSKRIK